MMNDPRRPSVQGVEDLNATPVGFYHALSWVLSGMVAGSQAKMGHPKRSMV